MKKRIGQAWSAFVQPNHLRFALAALLAYSILSISYLSLTVTTVDENENYLDQMILRPVPGNKSSVTDHEIENEDHFVQKPWLVLHVGPPKTGTTTIQNVLLELAPQLASTDNVFYMGKPGRAPRARFEYQQTGSDGRNKRGSSLAFGTLSGFLKKNDNLHTATMKWHLQQKHNVVCSHELLTGKLGLERKKYNYFDVYGKLFLQEGGEVDRIHALEPEQERRRRLLQSAAVKNQTQEEMDDFRLLHAFHHDDSSTFGFEAKIVVTYRHYFQWLPSYYYQDHLLGLKGQKGKGAFVPLCEYIDKRLDEIGKEYHAEETKTSEPTIDFSNSTWLHSIPSKLRREHGALYSYIMWSAPQSLRNRVEIFDLHQQQIIPANHADGDNDKPNLIRDFVCQVLPDAASTCLQLHNNNTNEQEHRARTHAEGSALETGILSTTQCRQLIKKAKSWFPKLQKQTYKNLTWEDSVFVLKGDTYRFEKAERLIRKNFESWAKRRSKRLQESDESDDHKVLCLNEESTRKLRNVSWNMLRHLEALARSREATTQDDYLFKASHVGRPNYPLLLSPKKYNHDLSYDADWLGPVKRAHDDLFQETVQSGAYCELDLDRLFADKDFMAEVLYTK